MKAHLVNKPRLSARRRLLRSGNIAADASTDRLAKYYQRDPTCSLSVLPVSQPLAGFAQPSHPVGTSECKTRTATNRDPEFVRTQPWISTTGPYPPSCPLLVANPGNSLTSACNSAALILDSLDQKKGSVKGLCMAEAKKGKKVGEGARFLKVVVEVLKCRFPRFLSRARPVRSLNVLTPCADHVRMLATDRPHIQHLLTATKLLSSEPTLFVPPSSVAALNTALKSGSAASANKALKTAAPKWQKQQPKKTPTPENLASVMVHDLLFAKRGLSLPKEHKVRKKLEKYKPA